MAPPANGAAIMMAPPSHDEHDEQPVVTGAAMTTSPPQPQSPAPAPGHGGLQPSLQPPPIRRPERSRGTRLPRRRSSSERRPLDADPALQPHDDGAGAATSQPQPADD